MSAQTRARLRRLRRRLTESRESVGSQPLTKPPRTRRAEAAIASVDPNPDTVTAKFGGANLPSLLPRRPFRLPRATSPSYMHPEPQRVPSLSEYCQQGPSLAPVLLRTWTQPPPTAILYNLDRASPQRRSTWVGFISPVIRTCNTGRHPL